MEISDFSTHGTFLTFRQCLRRCNGNYGKIWWERKFLQWFHSYFCFTTEFVEVILNNYNTANRLNSLKLSWKLKPSKVALLDPIVYYFSQEMNNWKSRERSQWQSMCADDSSFKDSGIFSFHNDTYYSILNNTNHSESKNF